MTCNNFKRVTEYQFGRPGCIYDVPGQYLVVNNQSTFIATCTWYLVALRLGAVSCRFLVFPLQHSVDEESGAISISLSTPFTYSASNRLVYDITWSSDDILFLLECSLSTKAKIVHKYAVSSSSITDLNDGLDFSSTPSFMCNHIISRIIWTKS